MQILQTSQNTLFKLKLEQVKPLNRKIISLLEVPMGRLLGIQKINHVYQEIQFKNTDNRFLEHILQTLKIDVQMKVEDVARLPTHGPLVVVANHPFGLLDGVIMGSILRMVRQDFKIMATYMLDCIPEMQDFLLLVDPYGKKDSAKANLKPLKNAIQYLKNGGALGVFPSGAVSHVQMKKGQITDPGWSQTIAGLIRKTQATVIPLYFDGNNSLLFQTIGTVHGMLRTAMLPRELLHKSEQTVRVEIGRPITYEHLYRFEENSDMIKYLRLRTYLLRHRSRPELPLENISAILPYPTAINPIEVPHAKLLLENDIQRLPADSLLLEQAEFQVYVSESHQIPHILREIGRLREVTFRGVCEGTGRAVDLDVYDQYYLHLFVWNKEQNEVVGAYRIGKSDFIIAARGKKGLYTNSLFKFRSKLFKKLGPSLELGRSFVRPEYQRSYSALLLLWKGIGTYVQRHPQYKYLFGPVSISRTYHPMSRQMMLSLLEKHHAKKSLRKYVKARNPLKIIPVDGLELPLDSYLDDKELRTLIEDVEGEPKTIPILLTQYLKLGGKFLGSNVDIQFSDVLDILLVMDLTKTEEKTLQRYMGVKEAQTFLAYHQKSKDN